MAPAFLDLSLGAIQIGTLLAWVIYRMWLVQTYVYYASCQQDRLWLKLMVAVVWSVIILTLIIACLPKCPSLLETLHIVPQHFDARSFLKICTQTLIRAYLYFLTVAGIGTIIALLRLPWYFGVSVTVQTTAGTVAQVRPYLTKGSVVSVMLMLSVILCVAGVPPIPEVVVVHHCPCAGSPDENRCRDNANYIFHEV